ncbi:MAG: hypothetical protein ACREVG_11420 [Burkholderiales bacterium]
MARRRWEERAWKAGGSNDPRFAALSHDLIALHAEFSTDASLEMRDVSVVKPPSRNPSTVRVTEVELATDMAVIRTLEDEFEGLLPIAYKVVAVLVEGQWRLKQRVTDHGRGRRINRL